VAPEEELIEGMLLSWMAVEAEGLLPAEQVVPDEQSEA